MIFIFISKKDNKQNQPKKPSQSGLVADNLFKMAPWSNWTWVIWGTFRPILQVKKIKDCS